MALGMVNCEARTDDHVRRDSLDFAAAQNPRGQKSILQRRLIDPDLQVESLPAI